MPYALAAVASGVVFAGLSDGTLMRSGDRGESWERLPGHADRVLALAAREAYAVGSQRSCAIGVRS